MAERRYFDWNATAPLRGKAHESVIGALGLTGNASSVHAEGRAARHLVEEAREKVANLVGAEVENVTFTSSATEANTLALTPALEVGSRKESRDFLFVSAIEHPSVPPPAWRRQGPRGPRRQPSRRPSAARRGVTAPRRES